jgi:hypothetical protein
MDPINQLALIILPKAAAPRCEACHWFARHAWQSPDWGVCRWPIANLPASMPREAVPMRTDEGTDCAVWAATEEKP